MHRIAKLMKLHRLMDPAGENGSDTGGTGTGSTGDGQGSDGQGADGKGDEGAGEGQGEGEGGEKSGDGQGGSKPTDAEAKLLRDVMKHKDRAKQLETQLSALQQQVKQFEGIDPEKVRKMLADQQAAEEAAAIARGDFDRVRQQMAQRHAEETAALKQQIEAAQRAAAAFQGEIAELTIGGQFSRSEFISKELTLTPAKARVIYGPHFEFKDGKVVGFDKPAGASDRTMLVDAQGEALPFDLALQKIIEADPDPDKDLLLRSRSRRGSGSNTQTKGAKAADATNQKTMTPIDRIAAGLKNLAKQP